MSMAAEQTKMRAEAAPGHGFRYLVLVLNVLGMPFRRHGSFSFAVYKYVVVVGFHCMYPILQLINSVYGFMHDLPLMDNLPYSFGAFLGMVKTLVTLKNCKLIEDILYKLERPPFTPNSSRGGVGEEKLFKECQRISNMQAFAYWTFAAVTMSVAISYSLFIRLTSSNPENWRLPYGSFEIIDITHSPRYEMYLLYQCISYFYLGFQFASIDLIIAAILCNICYQFKILQLNLRRLVYNAMKEMNKGIYTDDEEIDIEVDGSHIPWKYLRKPLREVIEYHLSILSIGNEMESVFSNTLLLVFLCMLLTLSLLVVHISSINLGNSEVAKFGLEAVIAIFQVFLVSIWGEKVIEESTNVGTAAYDTHFVGTDLRFQKALVLIIRRSQDPTKLTAGKFADVCVATFAWVIQSAYSSYVFLSNMNAKLVDA